MILLERTSRFENGGLKHKLVLIVGLGLIGQAVATELSRRGFTHVATLPYSWGAQRAYRQSEVDVAFARIRSHVKSREREGAALNSISVDLVWCAGKGGFTTPWATLDAELCAFQTIISLSVRLQSALPSSTHSFHLTSSAGGLYEGQINVGPNSLVVPLRPYSELKLEQEKQVGGLGTSFCKFVYRPSSVYGLVSLKGRLGLIPTLIKNAMDGRVTNIFADATNLRDYLLATDVATFMAQTIESYLPGESAVYLLASAKPASALEVIRLLERVMDQSLYFVFRATKENTLSNTYSLNAIAKNFFPQDLETGIRILVFNMRGHLSRNVYGEQRYG